MFLAFSEKGMKDRTVIWHRIGMKDAVNSIQFTSNVNSPK